ncbi:hypothetical protein [Polyangium sp. y55x31]|uniref:hypothetical protein n=1 Tax=Polyangium sp. y55x31 TaxID=3042688 RepID=UPI0024830973|nr:hypothetical protein [Polyangium sp. y55x31]MDI1479502.1 hypothetical protein [Polyangium sp. y55x31]
MRRSLLLASFSIVLAVGCGASRAPEPAAPAQTGQTFADAVKLMCEVDQRAGLTAEEDPLAIGQQRTAWLADHIENPDGIEFRTLVSVKGPEEQAQMIRAKAKEIGMEKCPLADSIEATSAGGLSP